MTWTKGLQLVDATSGVLNLNFANDLNQILMADRGINKVITDCEVTANGSSNLTTTANDIDLSSGTAIINGVERTVGAQSISLDTEYGGLSSGESRYVIIYLTSAATPILTAVAGTVGSGTIFQPELPEDVLTVAVIYLTFGTTVLLSTAIKDYRVFTPPFIYAAGGKIAGPWEVTGDITVGGTVDGVDLAALKSDVDGFPDELKNLTADEITLLENIDSTTISVAQWGYLGALDQALNTGASPTFVNGTFSGNITMSTGGATVDGVDLTALNTTVGSNTTQIGTNTSGIATNVTGISNNGTAITAAQTDIDGFDDELKNLTTVEVQQLQNINTITIINTQWGYLGALDQALNTSVSPTFAGMTLAGNLVLAANAITGTSVNISNAELQQLSLIGSTTISAGQWAVLGGLNSGLTATELNYVNGVTSAIQTQFAGKSSTSHTHSAQYISMNLEGSFKDSVGWNLSNSYALSDVNSTTNICFFYPDIPEGLIEIRMQYRIEVASGGGTAAIIATLQYQDGGAGSSSWIDHGTATDNATTTTNETDVMVLPVSGVSFQDTRRWRIHVQSFFTASVSSIDARIYSIRLKHTVG